MSAVSQVVGGRSMNSSMEFPVVVAHHIMRTRPRSTELDANRDKAEKPIKMHSWTSWIAIGLVLPKRNSWPFVGINVNHMI